MGGGGGGSIFAALHVGLHQKSVCAASGELPGGAGQAFPPHLIQRVLDAKRGGECAWPNPGPGVHADLG